MVPEKLKSDVVLLGILRQRDAAGALGAGLRPHRAPGRDPAASSLVTTFRYDGSRLDPKVTFEAFTAPPYGVNVAASERLRNTQRIGPETPHLCKEGGTAS